MNNILHRALCQLGGVMRRYLMLKRQGLAAVEQKTQRKGLKLLATVHILAASHSARARQNLKRLRTASLQ